MLISDLMNRINLQDLIKNVYTEGKVKILSMFEFLWNLEVEKWDYIDLIGEEKYLLPKLKSAILDTFIKNRAALVEYVNMMNFEDYASYEKVTHGKNTKNGSNNQTTNSTTTNSTGAHLGSNQNQIGQLYKDTNSANGKLNIDSNETSNNEVRMQDVELGQKMLFNKLSIEIEKGMEKFIVENGRLYY